MDAPNHLKTVAIIGASDNPARYAYMAMRMLDDHGHTTYLVSPRLSSIEGRDVFVDISALAAQHPTIDTVTMYVGSAISGRMSHDLIALKPRRVIFNPGAENRELAQALINAGIEVLEACTLVLLQTDQF